MLNRLRVAALFVCLLISASLFATPREWTGAVNANWSEPGNWSPAGPPVPGEALIFPFGRPNRNMINDLPAGMSFGPLTFNDAAYTVSGNLMTLTGEVFGLTSTADLKLGASLVFNGAENGTMDINGQTLTETAFATLSGTLNGTGTIVANTGSLGVAIAATGNFSGTMRTGTSIGGVAFIPGTSLPNATVVMDQLRSFGRDVTVGDVTMTAAPTGKISLGPLALLHTKSLLMRGGSMSVSVDSADTSRVDVAGPVTVSGALLFNITSSPAFGQTFTIISNDGTDPVNGIFTGLPEGAIAASGFSRFRISYRGGDGNDVTITTLAETSIVLSQDSATTQFGEPIILSATISSFFGTAQGSATFTVDGKIVGTVALVDGSASHTISTIEPGSHNITVLFQGAEGFADITSAAVSHLVTRRHPSIAIAADHVVSTYGQLIRFTATATASGSIAPLSGNVTIVSDGVDVGTGVIVNGVVEVDTASLHAGAKFITARYDGDSHFEPGISPAIALTVNKAPTSIDVRFTTPVLLGETPFIDITVIAPQGVPSGPSGTVSISDESGTLDSRVLDSAHAVLVLQAFALGDHALVVSYGGSADYGSSMATITQSVVAPGISISGTRVREGDSGESIVSLTVALTARMRENVRVSFTTVAGSATEGEDYAKASGVIEFAPGELTHSIELRILGDTFAESDETFSVVLSDPVNATIDVPSAVVVIANDDQVPGRHRPSRH